MTRFKQWMLFIFIFFCVGYVLGTFTLALVIQSLTDAIRGSSTFAAYEKYIIVSIIIIYLIYSYIISGWIYHWVAKKSLTYKTVVLSILSILLAYCIWYWLHPPVNNLKTQLVKSQDGRFVIGPYPDADEILTLKRQGYTAIISLLSPYVVPFEPVLIEKEQVAAKKAGIPLIQIPLLPWITKNTNSIDQIKKLALEKNHHKYYVHCYYGRDRVSMFIRLVDQVVATQSMNQVDQTKLIQSIKRVPFERGPAIQFDDNAIFAPTPTTDEFLGMVVSVSTLFTRPIQTVISVQGNRTDLTDAEQGLKRFIPHFKQLNIEDYPYHPEELLNVANLIKSSPKPVFIYSDLTSSEQPSPNLEGILVSYLTGKLSLPVQYFKNVPMRNGRVLDVAPNIAIGPRPTESEFQLYLYALGLRSMVYIGDCSSEIAKTDAVLARAANLSYQCVIQPEDKLYSMLASGGPWYLYGSNLDLIEDKFEASYQAIMKDIQ